MKALLRAELLKLRTTRTFVVLAASAVLLSLLIVVLAVSLVDEWGDEDVRGLFTADFTGLFILILGVVGMAGEWRHRTITSTVLASPRRVRLLAAKVLAYAAAGALLSLLVTLAIIGLGSAILVGRGFTTLGAGDVADVLWRNLVVAAYLGALGVLVGGIVRNQIAAIVGLLLVTFALEPTLLALAPDVGRFGPLVAAPDAIVQSEGEADDDALPVAAALAVLAGWIALFFAAAAALFERRDLT